MGKLLCNIFGHGWNYARIRAKAIQDVRFCRCCHRIQEWHPPVFPVIKNSYWSWSIQYKDFGAKRDIEGYGKE